MIRTLEATGKTVEEARAKACAQLGVEADALNVSFEVLEMPQKTGFLGLKLIPAKVRVSVEELDGGRAAAPGAGRCCGAAAGAARAGSPGTAGRAGAAGRSPAGSGAGGTAH